ncbi:unnamed protein product [Moneuplotes crassus]|uniref:Uncharacterized protein n=1 Tax=Euplotes crassus TaxID=5936 RepID=A0AAD1UDP7_EUPCR|nr:unnamed protein product [Moneuplotes crassus]
MEIIKLDFLKEFSIKFKSIFRIQALTDYINACTQLTLCIRHHPLYDLLFYVVSLRLDFSILEIKPLEYSKYCYCISAIKIYG